MEVFLKTLNNGSLWWKKLSFKIKVMAVTSLSARIKCSTAFLCDDIYVNFQLWISDNLQLLSSDTILWPPWHNQGENSLRSFRYIHLRNKLNVVECVSQMNLQKTLHHTELYLKIMNKS